jgi:hypothetical protein
MPEGGAVNAVTASGPLVKEPGELKAEAAPAVAGFDRLPDGVYSCRVQTLTDRGRTRSQTFDGVGWHGSKYRPCAAMRPNKMEET